MTIRIIIANASAAIARVAGFAQQAAGIDAGRVWAVAPIMPFTGILWSKHLPVSVGHSRSGVCARDLNRTQTGNYSVGEYVWREREGRGHAE